MLGEFPMMRAHQLVLSLLYHRAESTVVTTAVAQLQQSGNAVTGPSLPM